jgi:hypothetical protein
VEKLLMTEPLGMMISAPLWLCPASAICPPGPVSMSSMRYGPKADVAVS